MIDLEPYVEGITHQLIAAAALGDDRTQELAARLAAPLGSAIRLSLQDVVVAATAELEAEVPGLSVQLDGNALQLRVEAAPPGPPPADPDAGPAARINLRLPEDLKVRVESAAHTEGISVNTWLVRAISSTVDRSTFLTPARTQRSRSTVQGWVR